jgi:hypothetical protein
MPGSPGNNVLVRDECPHKRQLLSVGFLRKRVVLKQGFDLEPPNFTWLTIHFKTFIYSFDKISKCSIVLRHDRINLVAKRMEDAKVWPETSSNETHISANVLCLDITKNSCFKNDKHPRKLTRQRCWLRHCATSRKVAASIPDGVIGIFR